MIYELDNVSFSYDGSPAISEISFSVKEQESIAILGANGSGKSTLVFLLAGLIFPQKNFIRFKGVELSPSSLKDRSFSLSLRQEVGVLLQNPDAMLFCDTVMDEIAFGPLQLGWDKRRIQERVQELSELFGISHLLEKSSLRLSSGEKKKVCFAAILSVNPDILILDEPLSGLDPRSQAWTVEILIKLKEQKKTLIVTTHDLESVEDYADRTIVLGEDHSILRDGPAHEILDDVQLLLRANLIHEHAHRHGRYAHIHPHAFRHEHEEE